MDLQRHQLKPKEEDCQNVWIVHIPKMNGLNAGFVAAASMKKSNGNLKNVLKTNGNERF